MCPIRLHVRAVAASPAAATITRSAGPPGDLLARSKSLSTTRLQSCGRPQCEDRRMGSGPRTPKRLPLLAVRSSSRGTRSKTIGSTRTAKAPTRCRCAVERGNRTLEAVRLIVYRVSRCSPPRTLAPGFARTSTPAPTTQASCGTQVSFRRLRVRAGDDFGGLVQHNTLLSGPSAIDTRGLGPIVQPGMPKGLVRSVQRRGGQVGLALRTIPLRELALPRLLSV
jgi:hypothetical protein